MTGFVGANVANECLCGVRNGIRIRFEIIAEKRGTVLIDNLTLRLIGEIDRGKPTPDAFDQDLDTDESDRRLIRSTNCTNEVGNEPVVR